MSWVTNHSAFSDQSLWKADCTSDCILMTKTSLQTIYHINQKDDAGFGRWKNVSLPQVKWEIMDKIGFFFLPMVYWRPIITSCCSLGAIWLVLNNFQTRWHYFTSGFSRSCVFYSFSSSSRWSFCNIVYTLNSSKFVDAQTRLTQRMPLVEQELLTLPEHMSSPPIFSEIHVTRSLILCVYFVDCCLSYCAFSFCHCVVCSLICGFWLPLCFFKLFFGGPRL